MVFIASVSSFVNFGGQKSKNVHDFQKTCPEMTLCVYACFVEFYVFVLDEMDVVGPKLVYEHVWVANAVKTSPRTIQGSLRKDPRWWPGLPKTAQTTEVINAQ